MFMSVAKATCPSASGGTFIRIGHHNTGAIIDRPLEADGVRFYADAEEVLARLPRRGIPMVLRELKDGNAKAVRVQHLATDRSARA
jgi:hypothetical protein